MSNQQQSTSTPIELYRRGMAALQERLGPVDSVRFLHLFDQGSGDYTADRQMLVDSGTLDSLCDEIRAYAAKE